MESRPGDWQCPNPNCVNHASLVWGSKANCPKCGQSRGAPFEPADLFDELPAKAEKGMQGGDMPGDWQCPNTNCMNSTKMVFAKHTSCPSCGTARNAKQPGDWQCPNFACVNNKNTVFASKLACPKCGTPKPGSPAAQAAVPMLHVAHQQLMAQAMGGGCGGCGGGGAPPLGAKPGDWQCPNESCLNHRKFVFGKNNTCPKCNSPKPMMSGRGPYATPPVAMGGLMMGPAGFGCLGGMGGGANVGMGGMGCGGGKGRGGGPSGRPNDWKCPNADCLNHRNNVFGKHETCPNCGEARPASAMRSSPY